ncbi:hypothetical protein E2C01_088912 [Portunus trituberculatus]|uniref:Uncharacterized protein n=1 Tax=Portunus trituberculatus TaxID=210409 RepID=A0A5B7J7E8_PORTR|nr:hypothetical protein [Portunus trituberculatus]
MATGFLCPSGSPPRPESAGRWVRHRRICAVPCSPVWGSRARRRPFLQHDSYCH